MARCTHCKRKGFVMSCTHCSSSFCTSCLQLEVHGCKKLETKIRMDQCRLEERLSKGKSEASHNFVKI